MRPDEPIPWLDELALCAVVLVSAWLCWPFRSHWQAWPAALRWPVAKYRTRNTISVWLIRHAKATHDWSHHDGHVLAPACAVPDYNRLIGPCVVITSPLWRALETTRLLFGRGRRVIVSRDASELPPLFVIKSKTLREEDAGRRCVTQLATRMAEFSDFDWSRVVHTKCSSDYGRQASKLLALVREQARVHGTARPIAVVGHSRRFYAVAGRWPANLEALHLFVRVS